MRPLDFDFDHPALNRPASVEEVADLLRAPIPSVAQLVKEGKIRFIQPNDTARIDPADLVSYLEANGRVPPNGDPCDMIAMAALLRAAWTE